MPFSASDMNLLHEKSKEFVSCRTYTLYIYNKVQPDRENNSLNDKSALYLCFLTYIFLALPMFFV